MSDDLEPTSLDDVAAGDDRIDRTASEEALRRFFAAGFQPGALLDHTWLQTALDVPDPKHMNTLEAYQKWHFTYMSRFAAFQKALLVTHNIALANVYGKGYRIVLPGEQSAWALHESTRDMRRALSKGVARASHVNLHALTPAERAAQTADLDRIRSLREMLRRDEAAAKARARRTGMVGEPWNG